MSKVNRYYLMVSWDKQLGGYVYQKRKDSPLRGPFRTRAEAYADAEMHP